DDLLDSLLPAIPADSPLIPPHARATLARGRFDGPRYDAHLVSRVQPLSPIAPLSIHSSLWHPSSLFRSLYSRLTFTPSISNPSSSSSSSSIQHASSSSPLPSMLSFHHASPAALPASPSAAPSSPARSSDPIIIAQSPFSSPSSSSSSSSSSSTHPLPPSPTIASPQQRAKKKAAEESRQETAKEEARRLAREAKIAKPKERAAIKRQRLI
ncbi:MAG: hypothetical protein Q8P67_05620, partial [archaeon]|nr:hypothetical protein [archaeon]